MAESITLSPPEHDKIGVIHCGLPASMSES